MITHQQRAILKKLLKGQYISDVQDILKQRKIFTKNGKFYDGKMISHVFNGRYENLKIEDAIFKVYEVRRDLRQQDQDKKNRILGFKSPLTNGGGDESSLIS